MLRIGVTLKVKNFEIDPFLEKKKCRVRANLAPERLILLIRERIKNADKK